MKAWGYLSQLAALPARGAGTEGERRAADWLREQGEKLGYDVEIQPFRTPRHTLYVGPAFVAGLLIVAIVLAGVWPPVAFALALLSFIPLIGEVLGSGPNFDLILPMRPSQNVFFRPGKAKPEGNSKDIQDVIVVAHYDAQWGSLLFAPAFRPFLQPFFYATYGGFGLGLVAVVLRWVLPTAGITSIVTYVALSLLVLCGGFLLLSQGTGKTVPGANDNGSGVAVALAVAEEWAHKPADKVRLAVLFTGAEEVGLRGMHHFVKGARAQGLGSDTIFVNLDNVGGGRLRYMLGEGMVGYQHYDAALVALAGRLAEEFDTDVLPLENILLPTDALVPAKAGYPAITFLATREDESIPEYHWHTDTLENVDRTTVEQTERFVKRFVEELAARVDASSM